MIEKRGNWLNKQQAFRYEKFQVLSWLSEWLVDILDSSLSGTSSKYREWITAINPGNSITSSKKEKKKEKKKKRKEKKKQDIDKR